MSGGKNIAFQVEISEKACIPTCENYGEYYKVILPSDGVKREIIGPFFEYVLKAHANYRLSEHHDASESATVHLAWLKTSIRRGVRPVRRGAHHLARHLRPDPCDARGGNGDARRLLEVSPESATEHRRHHAGPVQSGCRRHSGQRLGEPAVPPDYQNPY